jgi:hypothetical protein
VQNDSKPSSYDAFGIFGPSLERLNGKRQYFSGERFRKLQTHRRFEAGRDELLRGCRTLFAAAALCLAPEEAAGEADGDSDDDNAGESDSPAGEAVGGAGGGGGAERASGAVGAAGSMDAGGEAALRAVEVAQVPHDAHRPIVFTTVNVDLRRLQEE